MSNTMKHPPQQTGFLALKAQVGNLITYGHEQPVEETLYGVGIGHFHLNLAYQALPLARTVYDKVGTDLPGIFSYCLRLLREIKLGSGEQMGYSGEKAVTHPGWREVGNQIIVPR